MFSVCLVKIMNHINGYIYIKDDYLKFCYNENKIDMEDISYDKELGRCYGSIFKGQKSDREKINLIIKYKDFEKDKLQRKINDLNEELNDTKQKNEKKINTLEAQIEELEKKEKNAKNMNHLIIYLKMENYYQLKIQNGKNY